MSDEVKVGTEVQHYTLETVVTRIDGKTADLGWKVLPSAPYMLNVPVKELVHVGDGENKKVIWNHE